MNLFDLKNEIAVVIGGTGALGGVAAEALAGAGAKVVIIGRNAERGQQRVASIQKNNGQALVVAADASDKVRAIRS